jgi:hypothetical protein
MRRSEFSFFNGCYIENRLSTLTNEINKNLSLLGDGCFF